MGGAIEFHEGYGQNVRAGDWRAQCAATHDLFVAAVNEGRLPEAAQLARYTTQECAEPMELFNAWLPQIRDFMRRGGVSDQDIADQEAALIAEVMKGRGRPLQPELEWQEVCRLAEEAAVLCETGDASGALVALESSRVAYLDVHDRLCDWVQGMVGLAARHLGEKQIGALWQLLMGSMIDGYKRYDIDHTPWERSAEILLYVTAEALRGHLSGPHRRGDIEVIEEKDRIGFRFRPCGSGGRNVTGQTYGIYPVTTEKHDWAWNMEGVCLYCAHCCVLSELNPIRRLGYPAREVEPPYENREGRRDFCTWWIYRDPALVPAHVYARTGHVKPESLGGSAARTRAAGT